MSKTKENDMYVFHNKIIGQIVKEQDEYIMAMIEDYVKKEQAKGELIDAAIIPEGKIRHIFNLGLSLYAEQNHIKLEYTDLFPETKYVEYLRRENDELRDRLNRMELSK